MKESITERERGIHTNVSSYKRRKN